MNRPPEHGDTPRPPATPRYASEGAGAPPPPPAGEPLSSVPPPSAPSPPPLARLARWGPGDALLGVLCVAGLAIAGGFLLLPFTGTDGLDYRFGSQILLELALVATAYGLALRGGERAPFAALGLRRPLPGWLKTTAAAYAIYLVAVFAIGILVAQPKQTDVADQLGFDHSPLTAIAAAILIVVIVPFCEELFFRGFFFAGMRSKLPFWAAALISALLFGAVHLTEANLIAGLQLTLLGLVLATVYERTDSLWANIALHSLNNAIAVAILVST